MLIRNLFEAPAKRIVAVMPGGFHPFHPGHKSLYDWAVKTFGKGNVYVAATNDTATRPFPFEVKKQLAAMAGVPKDRFIQVKSPFNAMSYKDIVDANTTALVFVRSLKDKNEQPLPDQTKKDGNPGYLKSYQGKGLETADVSGYMAYGPTIDFDFSGMQIKSASELRNTWPNMSDEDKLKAAKLMYGNGAEAAVQLLDKALGAVEEGWKDKLAAAGLAGAMALGSGAANARVSPDQDPGINRLTGKPNVVQQAEPSDSKSDFKTQAAKGYSKEYLQKAADPNRFGRYLISVEKAQELLDKMNGEVEEPNVAEAAYEGNIGIMELMKFFTKAGKEAPELVAKVKDLIKQKRDKEVWKIVQDYTGTKLKGAEFEGSIAEELIHAAETIRKVADGYRLYSKKGKNLGTFDTHSAAEKHEREVQYFKHKGK